MKKVTENYAAADDNLSDFTPMTWSLQEIRSSIPSHLFVRSTLRSLAHLLRDFVMAASILHVATYIDPYFEELSYQADSPPFQRIAIESWRWLAWGVYWWYQGLIFTGIWVVGHECGHGAFSPSSLINDTTGFITHTLLWTPYFSWRISHHRHHRNHASMERDEVYVPKTRSDLGIPQDYEGDWEEYFGDTPIYTLFMLIRQQLLAFPAYLMFNVSGQKGYPKNTNHFNPNSVLFSPAQRPQVILSNIGILFMIYAVFKASYVFSLASVVKYYGIPWLLVTHCFHITAPKWNFQRGAAATMDRDFLGWHGRFFLHDVAHFHVVHHFFPKMPWYHGAEATKYLKAFLGEHYHRSDEPVFATLWRNYNACQFVEDEGDVLFYKDKTGQAVRR